MAQRSASHPFWQQTPRSRKKKSRGPHRLLSLLLLAGLAGVASAYLLHAYEPRLRTEVRTIPALVHHQLAQHNASYVTVGSISPHLRHAIVAIEDRRFYHHPGIDPLGTLRALWVNLQAQHIDQGGSTLEEQLVKRVIVHDDRSLPAKLRTMILAWEVDREFSKRQVLEMYLNAAYYGRGAYGAAAAARVYFGTDAAHLTLPEAAFLAALPQAPSIYGDSPYARVIINRQHTVLADMATQHYISTAQARAADNTQLVFAFPNP